jgi:hypothetical protein
LHQIIWIWLFDYLGNRSFLTESAKQPISHLKGRNQMRMDICTLPRMRTVSKILCAAFALTLLYQPASAQNGRNGRTATRTAQAELHISVIVVPVVLPPRHHEHHDLDAAEVSYDLAPSAERLSVTEETRSMLVDMNRRGKTAEPVRLTTVVAK